MQEPLTDAELDQVLERFDQTDPKLQRQIVANAIGRLVQAQDLLSRIPPQEVRTHAGEGRVYTICKWCTAIAGTCFTRTPDGREIHPGTIAATSDHYVITGHVAGCLWNEAQLLLKSQ